MKDKTLKLDIKHHMCPHINDKMIEITSGEQWTKFIAKDDGTARGDYSVEIHGFRDSSGETIITDVIILDKPSPEYYMTNS